MQTRTIAITNRLGLHARAAAKLVRLAAGFRSEIRLTRTDQRGQPADAKSIFNVLLLAATQGTVIEITAHGDDEEQAVLVLFQLIAEKFGEE